LLQEGAQLYDQGDYEGALARFEQAYQRFQSPKIFFNLGQAYRGLSRNVEAVEAFERFLAEAKDAPTASRQEAESILVALRARVAKLEIECDTAGAEVLIDGRVHGTTPVAQPILLAPGPHQVVVAKKGRLPFLQRLDLQPGTAVRVGAVFATRMEEKTTTPADTAGHVAAPGSAAAKTVQPLPDRDATSSPSTQAGAGQPDLKTALRSRTHDGQFGAFVHFERALVPGLCYGLRYGIEIGVGALIGYYKGTWLGVRYLLLDGALKPGTTVAMPVFIVDGKAVAGIQGGATLQWDFNRHVGLYADLSLSYFPGAAPDLGSVWFVPGGGVQMRL
jgi:hypothetical protein